MRMGRSLLRIIQVMNAVSMLLFVVLCIHSLSCHSNAHTDDGALSIVHTEENDNGEATVEVESNGDGEPTEQETKKEPVDVFYPTDQWQAVKEGQAIPAGLHVRMSMKTGEKEAKLMDGDNGMKYWKAGDKEGMINTDKKYFTRDELKRALKDFKTTKLDDTDLKREEEIKSKFRSYEELKADFEALNMGIKTDGEIVTELLETFKDENADVELKLQVLTELEYYLHQIDNAVLFKDLGGLPVLIKALNYTKDERIQKEAALVLGAATQSNPKVQVGALEVDALQLLLRLLSSQSNSSSDLRKKILYAVSSLCRHFPYAQKKLLDLGGLSAFGELFQEPGAEKIQLKAVTLLHDLMVERENAESGFDPANSVEVEKLRQYKLVPLKEAMVEQGWCELVPTLLDSPEHDSREKILNAMKTLTNVCSIKFKTLEPKLNKLRQEYIKLAKEETSEDDRYFTSLLQTVDKMISLIGVKDEL